ncbi:MAG: alpha/beta fold hydrolase [Deltaproteobacteria bacterium]|nr:alpha/beta fold hydrolase [Deltaproteobacteria bacterium]
METDIAIKRAVFRDGTEYVFERWIPRDPRALLIYIHDIGDHAGRQRSLIDYFSRRGCAITLYDQRGHGRSGGRSGDVDHFETWLDDLAEIIGASEACLLPRTPVYLIGHGVGALMALWYAVERGGVSGVVAASLPLRPLMVLPRWKERVAEKLAVIAPKRSFASTWLPARNLPDDRNVLSSMTLRTSREIARVTALLMPLGYRLRLPLLLLHGHDDRHASFQGTRDFFSRLALPGNQLMIYDNRGHDLFSEGDITPVLSDMEQWLELCLRDRSTRPSVTTSPQESVWQPLSVPLSSL